MASNHCEVAAATDTRRQDIEPPARQRLLAERERKSLCIASRLRAVFGLGAALLVRFTVGSGVERLASLGLGLTVFGASPAALRILREACHQSVAAMVGAPLDAAALLGLVASWHLGYTAPSYPLIRLLSTT